MKLKNKKASLEEHVSDIIIAALCLILIVVAAVLIYRAFSNDEFKNATSRLDALDAKINNLKDGQKNKFIVQGFVNANNWVFVAWNKDQKGRPDKCYFKSCICICPFGNNGKTIEDRSAMCQSSGVCRLYSVDNINILLNYVDYNKRGGDISTMKQEAIFSSQEANPDDFHYITLTQNLIEIEVSKNKNSIELNRTL